MYWHELIRELEIIPAWECFLVGMLVGMLMTLAIIGVGTWGGGDDEGP